MLPKTCGLDSESCKGAINQIEKYFITDGRDVQFVLPLVSDVIEYLGNNPSDGYNRLGLTRVLEVDVSGKDGLLLNLFSLLGKLTETKIGDIKIKREKEENKITIEQFLWFFKRAISSMKLGGNFQIGSGKTPAFFLKLDVNGMLKRTTEQLEYFSNALVDRESVTTMMMLLHVGVLLSRIAHDRNQDLHLVHVAGAKLAAIGQGQKARDLAEGALQWTSFSDSLERKRMAWYVFSDIYQRVNNASEAMVGLNCALALRDAPVAGEQVVEELYLGARILRDVRIPSLARRVSDELKKITVAIGLEEVIGYRLDAFNASLDMFSLMHSSVNRIERWNCLLNDFSKIIKKIPQNYEEMLPFAVLLGQAISHADGLGIDTKAAMVEFADVIKNINEPMKSRVIALSEKVPTASMIKAMFNDDEKIRYSEDVGYDFRSAAVLARRSITSKLETVNALDIAYAIELLCDHTAGPRCKSGEYNNVGEILSVEDFYKFALNTSNGHSLHFMALDNNDKLVRIVIDDGKVLECVRESGDIFSFESFKVWQKHFPSGYKDLDTPDAIINSEHRNSLNGISIDCNHRKTVMLVREARLQVLPPNLFLFGDDFAGECGPTVSIPSLNWLRRLQNNEGNGNVNKAAWIPTDGSSEKTTTLQMLAGSLDDTFSENGVACFNSNRIPLGLENFGLLIIGGHGGLTNDGDYFQSVSDETGVFFSGRSISSAICAEVVVLFVCSGGRIDTHPYSSSTVGLTKSLLKDGTRTVVASPWPIDWRVAPNWLPIFLAESKDGKNVAEAVFAANQAVRKCMGDNPSYHLAMNVYGDSLVKINWDSTKQSS